ncbi:MAG: hypothetical protein HWE26_08980 [Alteromonadaceae bacterium]|nr:hypothetical protein [Alteromonadaceae bacterium]
MEYQLKRLTPHSVALHFALAVVAVSLFLLLFTALLVSFTSGGIGALENSSLGVISITMPLVYFVLSYVLMFIAVLIYNLIAKKTGGIKIVLQSVEAPPATSLKTNSSD